MANSVDPDQTAPIGVLNSSVMLGNYSQQTTSTISISFIKYTEIY